MSAETFLILYGACTIAILLVTTLAFPFAPVRRWLARSADISTDQYGSGWVVQRMGQTISSVQPTKAKAWTEAEVGRLERVRRWFSDLSACPYCCGAWISAALVSAAAVEAGDVGLLAYWPSLWLAGSGSVVILDAIAER